MKSVITSLEIIEDETTLETTRYALALKGQPVPAVRVRKVQDLTRGRYSVTVEAPTGMLAVSTMDAIARRVAGSAKVASNGKGSMVHVRTYSV